MASTNCWNNTVPAATTITLNTAGAGPIDISNNAVGTAINIGTGAAIKQISIGELTQPTSFVRLYAGSSGITLNTTNGVIGMNSGTGTISMSTDASNTTINLATGAGVKLLTLGSGTTTSSTTVDCGTGGANFGTTANAHTTTVGSTTTTSTTTIACGTGGCNLGTSANAHTTTVGSTSSTSTTTIACGTGGCNLGTTANNHTTTVGTTNGTATTNINAGSGGIGLTGAVTSANAITITSGNMTLSSGNLLLPTTSSTVGQIQINATRVFHTYGTNNTFGGAGSGNFTLTGTGNTVYGAAASPSITGAINNVSIGVSAASTLSTGVSNISIGNSANYSVAGASYNVAVGHGVLNYNNTGAGNVGVGYNVLGSLGFPGNTGGDYNSSLGYGALSGAITGSYNVTLGYLAGVSYSGAETSNILISNNGTVGESNTIRIGTTGTGNNQQSKCWIAGIRGVTTGVADAIAVLIDSTGQLGTVSSSLRYKENIQDLGAISEAIHKLRPVVFNYKNHSPESKSMGLIAEEVEDILPQLVVKDLEGNPETIKYQDLPILLLNEIQKLRKELDELKRR